MKNERLPEFLKIKDNAATVDPQEVCLGARKNLSSLSCLA
jgi:hypothetical protein